MHFTSYRTVSTMQLQIDYGTQSNQLFLFSSFKEKNP